MHQCPPWLRHCPTADFTKYCCRQNDPESHLIQSVLALLDRTDDLHFLLFYAALSMQISSTELAHCLGLSVCTRYRVKDLTETVGKRAAEPEIPSPEIPSEATNNCTTSSVEKPSDTTVLDSVPMPMLPPRKRLKVSRSKYDMVGTSYTNGVVKELDKSGDLGGNRVADTVLDMEESSANQPDVVSQCEDKKVPEIPVSVRQPSFSDRTTVAPSCSSDSVTLTSVNTSPRKSFSSLSAPWMTQGKPVSVKQEPVRRGQTSNQTRAAGANAASLQSQAAVRQNWTVSDSDGAIGNIAPTLPPTAAVPAPPNVIHIPEDARVFQTEDGLVIIQQSDGTVQIHGHAEGQPLPLDVIQNLLQLDPAGDQTVSAVGGDNSGQVTQEPSQSPYSQSMPYSVLKTEYETAEQMIATAGVESLVAVDGRQYVTVDGSQAFMAYDPTTQSMVQIDPGQAFVTLTDGSALVAVDGTQPALSVDGGVSYVEQGTAGNHAALFQLLPSNHHMQ